MKIGFAGLGKMGHHMANRLMAAGIEVAGYDVNADNLAAAAANGAKACSTVEELASELGRPAIVWVQTPPGKITNNLIAELAEALGAGDLIVDGGNSDFRDSVKNAAMLADKGIRFVDCGVSGGVAGAEHGCGLLVGASDEDFELLTPAFEAMAAPGGYTHAGGVGAGHFAKMVHNGIQYAILEAYAEGYELLCASEQNINVLDTLKAYQGGCTIRSEILEKFIMALEPDEKLEGVSGYVADSGMGRWTLEEAIRLKVPTPAIAIALTQRFRSQQEESPAMKSLAASRGTIGGYVIPKK